MANDGPKPHPQSLVRCIYKQLKFDFKKSAFSSASASLAKTTTPKSFYKHGAVIIDRKFRLTCPVRHKEPTDHPAQRVVGVDADGDSFSVFLLIID